MNGSLRAFAKNLKKDAIISKCDGKGSFLFGSIIDQNSNNLSEFFNMTNITVGPKDLSNQTIYDGTRLFLYLNICPSSKEDVRKYWNTFYRYLFTDALSSEQKVLSLIKIASDTTSKDGQDLANTIMTRLSKELGFRYYIPDVSTEIIGEKVNWKNNIRNIIGRYILDFSIEE